MSLSGLGRGLNSGLVGLTREADADQGGAHSARRARRRRQHGRR